MLKEDRWRDTLLAMMKKAFQMPDHRVRRAIALAFLLAVFFGCDNTIKTKPITVEYSGSITVEFNWIGGQPYCADCANTYATVNTSEWGDFDYGPLTFSYDGVYLSEVLGGYNRTITVWVTNNSDETLYRGEVTGVHIISGATNDPVTADIYPKGWYVLSTSQPSANWGLEKVRMSGDGSGWIAGYNTAGSAGVIFRGGSDLWAIDPATAPSSGNWALHSIAPSGAGAWAVGEDKQHSTGIILHNDGALWHDDVTEPSLSGMWSLKGVDFWSDGTGWAVGESRASTPEGGVVLKYDSGWSIFSGPAVLPNYTLSDVAGIATGEFIAGGEDRTTLTGIVIRWNTIAYDLYTPDSTVMTDCAGEWEISDVYAVSSVEWWAVGTCHDGAGDFGLVFHYQQATGLTRENITGPSGSWTLQGIWAKSSGEAWAVGNTPAAPVIYHRVLGAWTQVAPVSLPAGTSSWSLDSVDFPATGDGYAVGTDRINHRGIVMRYGFPK